MDSQSLVATKAGANLLLWLQVCNWDQLKNETFLPANSGTGAEQSTVNDSGLSRTWGSSSPASSTCTQRATVLRHLNPFCLRQQPYENQIHPRETQDSTSLLCGVLTYYNKKCYYSSVIQMNSGRTPGHTACVRLFKNIRCVLTPGTSTTSLKK